MTSEMMPRPKPESWMTAAAQEICEQPSCLEGVEADEANYAAIIAKHFATRTRAAPAGMAEIVAAAEAWVEAERNIFHAGSEPQADDAAHEIDAARARFLALVAAHEAEVERLKEIERLATDFIAECPGDDNNNAYHDGAVARAEFSALAEAICRD